MPAERRLEIANTQTNETCFHSIDDGSLLADQVLPLAIWASRVFLVERRDRRHVTMIRFAS